MEAHPALACERARRQALEGEISAERDQIPLGAGGIAGQLDSLCAGNGLHDTAAEGDATDTS